MVVGVSPSIFGFTPPFLANFPWIFHRFSTPGVLATATFLAGRCNFCAVCAEICFGRALESPKAPRGFGHQSTTHGFGGGNSIFFLNFHPDFVGKWSNLTNIFQMACNHRLVMCRFCFLFWYFWNHFLYVALTVKLSFFIQQLLPMKMWKFEGFATENRP